MEWCSGCLLYSLFEHVGAVHLIVYQIDERPVMSPQLVYIPHTQSYFVEEVAAVEWYFVGAGDFGADHLNDDVWFHVSVVVVVVVQP